MSGWDGLSSRVGINRLDARSASLCTRQTWGGQLWLPWQLRIGPDTPFDLASRAWVSMHPPPPRQASAARREIGQTRRRHLSPTLTPPSLTVYSHRERSHDLKRLVFSEHLWSENCGIATACLSPNTLSGMRSRAQGSREMAIGMLSKARGKRQFGFPRGALYITIARIIRLKSGLSSHGLITITKLLPPSPDPTSPVLSSQLFDAAPPPQQPLHAHHLRILLPS